MSEVVGFLAKQLSRNDLGLTGGHQGGILVPRVEAAVQFFPTLDVTTFNPRVVVTFQDMQDGQRLDLNFIYYNGKLHERSSRNEYRLTGLTNYLRRHDASVGDELEFRELSDGQRTINVRGSVEDTNEHEDDPSVITLSGNWRTIRRGNFL